MTQFNQKQHMLTSGLIALLLLCGSANARADSTEENAKQACADLSDGDACSYQNDQMENLDGICKLISDGLLKCVPYTPD